MYYLCAVFTLISAIVSFGFSIDALAKARVEKGAGLVNAKYAASRSCALLLVATGLLILPSKHALVALAVVMISVQLFDGIIGIKISRFKMIGPIITALCNAALLVLFLKGV